MTTRTGRRFSILFAAIAALAKTGSAGRLRGLVRSKWRAVLAAAGLTGIVLAAGLTLAPPAQAQTTTEIWSATMTVGVFSGDLLGYTQSFPGGIGSLSDQTFSHEGTSYTINELFAQPVGTNRQLHLSLNKRIRREALSDLTLVVGTDEFVLANGTITPSGSSVSWVTSVLSWSVNDSVSLSLKAVTRPANTSANVHFDGLGIGLHFDEILQVSMKPPKSAFSITADGSPVGIGLISSGGGSLLNLLSLSPAIGKGQTVELTYTDPTTGDDANAIQDTDGNDAHSFTVTVSNQSRVTLPALSAAAVPADGATVALTFSADLDFSGAFSSVIRGAFNVTVDGTESQTTGVTGSGATATLTMSDPIVGDQTVIVSYDRSDAGSEALGVSSNTLVADFTTGRDGVPAVVNNSEVDRSPPALTGAMVTSSGVAIELAFDEDLDLPATIPAALKDAFSVTVDGDTVAISGLAADGSSGLQINLSSRILKDQAVVVSYDQSAAGTNALDDDAGNEVVDFTTGSGGVPAVENDSTELSDDATLRGLSMSVQNALGNALVGVALSPAFDPGIEMYSVSVAYAKFRVTFMPATNHTDATVAYFDGDDMALADAGAGSSAVDEGHRVNTAVGPNTVKVKVTAPDGTTPKTYTVTVTRSRPTLSAATVPAGGTPVVLQWENDFPSGTGTLSAAAVAAFTVTADGVERQITGIVQEVTDNLLNVTLSTLIYQGQAVVVSYDSTAAGAAALLDTSGREYLSFTTGEDGVPAAANSSTVQAIAPGKPTGLAASASGDTRIDLSWTAPSDGGSAITGYKIEVSTDGSAPWTVLEADTGNTDTRYSHTGLSPGSTRHYRVSAINAGGTSEASSTVSATTTTIDPPTLSSGEVSVAGDTLVLVFDEVLDTNTSSAPPASAFAVQSDGVSVTVGLLLVAGGVGSQTQVQLHSLSPVIYQGQVVTVTYTDPTSGDDDAAIQDTAGNDAASFTDFAVTNNSNQVPPTCTLNPGDLWCGTLTVGTGTSGGSTFYGYGVDPGWGSLSPATFTHNGNTILVSAVQYDTSSDSELRFDISGVALVTGDNFVLHVGSQSFSFAGGSQGYSFPNHGLSWSVGDTVVVRLRDGSTPTEAVVPSLSVWDAAGSDDSDMAFTVTLSDPIAEEVTATWTASIAFGNTALAADLGSPTTGMVTFAPNATTARFVLHLPQSDYRGDRTFRVTLSGVSANAQLVSNWIATGTIIGTPTSCTLNSGDIWCGVVTVGKKAQLNGKILGWGFHQTWHTDGVGALPDRRFVYGGDSYRIDEVTVGAGGGDIPAGFLFFSMNRAFPVADEVRLALYVESIEFKLSEAHGPDFNTPTYHWRETGMDWSVASYVTLRLRGDITAAAHTEDSAAPLTAAFEGLPEAHDGETAFAFRIAFSEAVTVTPAAMRTRVLTVTGGAVTGAARVDGEPGVWAITVTPDTREALSISLPPAADCEADGAVCTADGRALSIGAAHLVNGPPDYARESNTEATGTPTISGTPQVGETLTADTSGIADDDGLKNVSFSYQWLADDTAIQGATGSAYTLIEADEGKTVSVRVSFTDDTGNGETLTSTATDAVAAATQPNNPATGAPAINGTAQVGETLTADTSGIADTDGLTSVSYSYQWLAGDSDISGATGSAYTLADADEGKTVTVRVSFTDDGGNDETLTSAATQAVAGNEEPVAREDVAAWSATMTVEWVYQGYGYYSTDTKKAGSLSPASFKVDGTTYTVKMVETQGWWMYIGVDRELPFDFVLELDGARFASGDASFRSYSYGNIYRWEGTGLSWKDGDTVEVRLLRAFEDETAVNSAATGAPIISGTVQVGEMLSANVSGIADTDGLTNATFSYQWLADDAAITGATGSTYTLADADEGKAIAVQVSFTDDAGNDETLASAATETVSFAVQPQVANSPATGAPTISGTARVGQTLTADTTGIADENGLDNAAFTYQWLADNAAIAGATDSTYTLADADEGKAIKVQVSFTDDAGNDETLTSAATDAVAAPEPPAKPTGLSATASHDSVTLSWDDPGDDTITGYVILRRNRDIHAEGEFTNLVENTGAAATTYTDDSVAAETPYTYRIKAINEHGESERSRWFHIDTPAAPDPADLALAEPPASPTGLAAEVSHDSVTLTWDDPGDDSITGYVILRRDSAIHEEGTFETVESDTGSAETTYTDDSAQPERKYVYRIKAINKHGLSEISSWVRAYTPAAPVPAAPTGLSATASYDQVVLTWDDPGDDTITGYVILRRNRDIHAKGEFTTLVKDTGGAATTYTDDSVASDTPYTYRIKAINEHGGVSERSRWFHIDTPAAPLLAAPTGVGVAVSSDTVMLIWANPQDDSITCYRILRRDGDAQAGGEFTTIESDTGSAATTYTDDTVEPERVYVYRVLAISPQGISEPSRDVEVSTTAPQEPLRALPGQQVRQNISEPSGDDFAADGSTQGRLEVDGSVTGNIASSGDQDAFAVELVQDRTYRFDLEGSETEQGTLADPAIVFIFLLDSSNNATPIGNTTDFDSGEGENSRLTFTLPSGTTYPTGTYYILVGEEGGDATGTYRLTMTRLTDDNKRIEAQLEPGDTVSGTFDPFTWYYFALDGLTSGRYTVSFSKGAIEAIYAAGNLITDQPHGAATYTFDVRAARRASGRSCSRRAARISASGCIPATTPWPRRAGTTGRWTGS